MNLENSKTDCVNNMKVFVVTVVKFVLKYTEINILKQICIN